MVSQRQIVKPMEEPAVQVEEIEVEQNHENQQQVGAHNPPGLDRSTVNQMILDQLIAQSQLNMFLHQLEVVQSAAQAEGNAGIQNGSEPDECNPGSPESIPEPEDDASDCSNASSDYFTPPCSPRCPFLDNSDSDANSVSSYESMPPQVDDSDASSVSTHSSMPHLIDQDDILSIPDSMPDLIDERDLCPTCPRCRCGRLRFRANSDEDNLSIPDSLPDLVPGSEFGDSDSSDFIEVGGHIETDYWDTFSVDSIDFSEGEEEAMWSDSDDSVLSDKSEFD